MSDDTLQGMVHEYEGQKLQIDSDDYIDCCTKAHADGAAKAARRMYEKAQSNIDALEAQVAERDARWVELRAYLVDSLESCERLRIKWDERENATEVYAFESRKTEVIEALDHMDALSTPADRLRAKARAMQLRRDRKTKWLEFESEPKGREP